MPIKAHPRETVAQFVEYIVAQFVAHPDRSPDLTDAERSEWRGFPALVRAYQGHTLYIDPEAPIAHFLRTSVQLHPTRKN